MLEGDSIISTNLKLRLDGLPRSDQKEPDDPGVAVYWQRLSKPKKVMAIDLYDRIADNLAAIGATLNAMRAIERHGGALILGSFASSVLSFWIIHFRDMFFRFKWFTPFSCSLLKCGSLYLNDFHGVWGVVVLFFMCGESK